MTTKIKLFGLFFCVGVLCSCVSTLSRSPVVMEKSKFAIGAIYTTAHDLTGPDRLESAKDPRKAEAIMFPMAFVSYGMTEKFEVSGSAYFAMSAGGLYGQAKWNLFKSTDFEFALISDVYAYYATTGKGPSENETLPHYIRKSHNGSGISLAPSLGYRLSEKSILFLGPELWLANNRASHERSSNDKRDEAVFGLLYGGFIGASGSLYQFRRGDLIGEVMVRGFSAPRSVIVKDRDFYLDGSAGLKFIF